VLDSMCAPGPWPGLRLKLLFHSSVLHTAQAVIGMTQPAGDEESGIVHLGLKKKRDDTLPENQRVLKLLKEEKHSEFNPAEESFDGKPPVGRVRCRLCKVELRGMPSDMTAHVATQRHKDLRATATRQSKILFRSRTETELELADRRIQLMRVTTHLVGCGIPLTTAPQLLTPAFIAV
jgi:hypothetical protein